ncbi:MAG: fumarate hydratase [Candidatus Fischerbacteria bacterium RBG_13_37_8]|uniref:Fumarate hydratase n=1 Tax=Candidatus Fischerbacteria bacterium RBG_13_37_8 TaxID=1817863 RepID=A0A1F5VN69_9BACT|nr:MAG: fumarate hydratase [Candidatus Fischerbacteria bacterium RBG_13_37_8]
MRTIKEEEILNAVKKVCIEAAFDLSKDVKEALNNALQAEESEVGKSILRELIENAEIASRERLALCQDTGFAVFFVEIGEQMHIEGSLNKALTEAVRQAYQEEFLRKSIVADPLRRKNTGDNTPCIIHISFVPGDKLTIMFSAKGGGSENMSRVGMLKPADGIDGVKNFIVETARLAGPNPCPPIIVGVGIGGTFEKAAQLAKRAIFRDVGKHNQDPFYADMEKELLVKINNLGIGPQGLGGRMFALAVNIDAFPCHIASLPLAVNIQCHSSRHRVITI